MRARLLTVAIVAVGLAGCGKSTPAGPGDNGTGGTGATTISIMSLDPSGSSASDYDSNGKVTSGYGSTFSPPTVTVTAGTTVTWKNNDAVVHEPASDTPGIFDSRLDASGTLNVQFATPGTYTYHCKIHPDMTGSVVVK